MTEPSLPARILGWLRAGYPDGVPPRDFPPVLGVLHRTLTDADIESIADELALRSVSGGEKPVTADDIKTMVRERAYQSCTEDELRRVSVMLAAGGWPLSAELT